MTDFEFKLPVSTHITRRLRYLIQTEYDGSYDKLFIALYDEVPDEDRSMLFKAYVEAGNVNGIFISMLALKTKIGQVPLARFFDVYVDNADLFN